jgi:hypothetical protein
MMKLSEIKEILLAEVFNGHDKMDIPIEKGTASDLMSDLLTGPSKGSVLLTGLCNVQAIRTSVISGISAIVFVRGKRPTDELIAKAKEHDLPLLNTPFTMFSSSGRLFSKGLRGLDITIPKSNS